MKINDMSYKLLCDINEREYEGGNVQRDATIQVQFIELLEALHDAINTPKGIIPDSADRFYCHEYYDK